MGNIVDKACRNIRCAGCLKCRSKCGKCCECDTTVADMLDVTKPQSFPTMQQMPPRRMQMINSHTSEGIISTNSETSNPITVASKMDHLRPKPITISLSNASSEISIEDIQLVLTELQNSKLKDIEEGVDNALSEISIDDGKEV